MLQHFIYNIALKRYSCPMVGTRFIASTPLEGEIARGGEINDVVLENWYVVRLAFAGGHLLFDHVDPLVRYLTRTGRLSCCLKRGDRTVVLAQVVLAHAK